MRRKTPKRKIQPDSQYKSLHIAKLINYIMRKGKKSVAQRVVYNSFDIIKEKTKKDPLDIFDIALKNASPDVIVKSRRIGGANYQIPITIAGDQKTALALRWIIDAAKEKKGKPMKEKLAMELIDAANNTGAAIKKKETVYKTAQANRAFAHFGRYYR